MSVSTVTMGPLLLLHDRGLLGESEVACDFGSMEFDSREPAANPVFEAIFRARGLEVPETFYDEETGRMYGTAGDYWRALGWEYTSYDIDGRFGSVVCDLNVDELPASEHGKYTLTMNGGTGEHVFNQYNFFRQVHNVTRVGGLMFHIVPFHLAQFHGFFQYSPVLFHSLAQYNGYDVLGLWQVGKPLYTEYRPAHARPEGRRVNMIALLRRLRGGEFVFPLQVNEPMILSPEAQARYGTFVQQATESLRPSEGLPDTFYLDVAAGSVHEGRLPKKLRAALLEPREQPAAKTDTVDAAREQASPRRRRGSLRGTVRRLVRSRPAEHRKV